MTEPHQFQAVTCNEATPAGSAVRTKRGGRREGVIHVVKGNVSDRHSRICLRTATFCCTWGSPQMPKGR